MVEVRNQNWPYWFQPMTLRGRICSLEAVQTSLFTPPVIMKFPRPTPAIRVYLPEERKLFFKVNCIPLAGMVPVRVLYAADEICRTKG